MEIRNSHPFTAGFDWQLQEMMARNYGLAAQLNCLNYCHLCKERTGAGSSPRWILADLSRDKVQSLQKTEGEKEMGQPGWQGFVEEVITCLHVFTKSNVSKTTHIAVELPHSGDRCRGPRLTIY